jgi:hypothetical protein
VEGGHPHRAPLLRDEDTRVLDRPRRHTVTITVAGLGLDLLDEAPRDALDRVWVASRAPAEMRPMTAAPPRQCVAPAGAENSG